MIISNRGIIGADISKYQGYPPQFPVVDFKKMRSYGFSFVVIKAGQKNYVDPAFYVNWETAKGVLPRSTYWYYDNSYSAIAQAKIYYDLIRPDPEGICWLDLEDSRPGDYHGWRYWSDFLETFKLLSGLPSERIGIYTAYYYWFGEMLKANNSERAYFKRYPLWLADYGKKGSDPLQPDFLSKVVPKPWKDDDCLMVQTGTPVIGQAAGVSSLEIDLNWFNGDKDKFNKIFGVVPTSDIVITIK